MQSRPLASRAKQCLAYGITNMNWVDALKVAAPAVLKVVFPQLTPFIPAIVGGIELAEDLATKDPSLRPSKKQIATDIVQVSADITNAISKAPIFNAEDFAMLVGRAIDTAVQAANEVKKRTDNVPEVKHPVQFSLTK